MAYKFPQTAFIIMRARVAQAATNATLSSVQFAQVDRGAAYLSGSPLASFTCPFGGDYIVKISSWNCGAGNGTLRCTSTRSATPVYDQSFGVSNGCYNGIMDFPILNCQAGDVITLQANENNTGSLVTSVTDPTLQGQGNCTIMFFPNT